MRTRTTAAAVGAVALLLTLTACGNSDTGPKASAAPRPPEPATTSSAPTRLKPEWGPKLDAVKQDTSVCSEPHTTTCADALTDIMTVVYDLEEAALDASPTDYAETLKLIKDLTKASEAYADDGCQGAVEVAGDCWLNATVIVLGPTKLKIRLMLEDDLRD